MSEIDWDKKPEDCICNYPETRYRNMTGHAPSCPSHARLLEMFKVKAKPAPASVSDGMHETHELVWNAARPMDEWDASAWVKWIEYQLGQSHSAGEHMRLTLLRDAVNRYQLTASQFAEFWARREPAT